jgi:RND family efflux transporter MFP subunit
MSDLETSRLGEALPREPAPPDHDAGGRPPARREKGGGARRWALGLAAIAVLVAALGFGVWRHYRQYREALAAAAQHRNFVPTVRVEAVRASPAKMMVTLPATTNAYQAASIYARASGYIEKRYVDIGSRVTAGQTLAEITAPELDHQIAQAEASVVQLQGTLRQTEANRSLAQITNERNLPLVAKNYVSKLQGDTDRLNFAAQEHAAAAARANMEAQSAAVKVLQQQKAYQKVVAPFDGVITQRNIDVGSLVTADATSGTSMFAMTHSDVMRIQLFVPQDAAFGVSPGVEAVVRVPEIPGRTFPGTVTRIADALQPGTRTLLTEIDVPNPDGVLTPGIYCTVELQVPRKTPSLIVPAGAIIFNRHGLQVALVENGVAHIRKVDIARDLGTEVEVRDGVKDGDEVVLYPPVELQDGGRVEIRHPPPGSNP